MAFYGDDFRKHTQCVSEAEKYQGGCQSCKQIVWRLVRVDIHSVYVVDVLMWLESG